MKIGESTGIRGTGAARARRKDGASRSAAAAPIADTVSVAGIPEVELTPKVQAAIQKLMSEVERLRTDLNMAHERVAYLERLADEDTLIPIYNRRAFVRELSRIVSYAERYSTPSSVLYFDVNGMKSINDQYGHAAGDAVLRHVAEILIANLRESDVVGRLGGDEFGVILTHAGQELAQEKSLSLAAAIENTPYDWNGNALNLSVAFGPYTFSGNENAGEALDRADQAMYAHKRTHNSNNGPQAQQAQEAPPPK